MSQYTKFFLLPKNYLNVTASSNLVYSSSQVNDALFSKKLASFISLKTKTIKHACTDCSQPPYHPQFKNKIAVQNVSESFIFTTLMLNGTHQSSKNSDVQRLTQDVPSHNIHTKATGEMQELLILDLLTQAVYKKNPCPLFSFPVPNGGGEEWPAS